MTCPVARIRVILGGWKRSPCSLNLPPHVQHHRPSGSWHNSAETRLPVEGSLPGAWRHQTPGISQVSALTVGWPGLPRGDPSPSSPSVSTQTASPCSPQSWWLIAKTLNPHPVSATLPPPRHPHPNAGKTPGQSHTQLVEEQKQEQKKQERKHENQEREREQNRGKEKLKEKGGREKRMELIGSLSS